MLIKSMDVKLHIMILSLKSLKNPCCGREFRPTFDNFYRLRSVQVVLESLNFGELEWKCLTLVFMTKY